MRIYLDTEFNGFGGQLISMAMVTEGRHEWYGVKELPEEVNPWVAEHVVPKLGQEPWHQFVFLSAFSDFITQFPDCEIIADWPADFEHFNAVMSELGRTRGFSIPMEYTMRFVKGDATIAPENAHNALSDARALRDWHLSTLEVA